MIASKIKCTIMEIQLPFFSLLFWLEWNLCFLALGLVCAYARSNAEHTETSHELENSRGMLRSSCGALPKTGEGMPFA